ncbi:glycosyltransferase family 4 protein [Patescibacteria group bacterium]|nr:glycosyltransferase family 4 protein [Patescibacteria group bacterium]
MKIFVDARMMGSETSRGIGRVIFEILRRLLGDSSIEWIVLVRKQEQMNGLPTPARAIVADIPWYGFQEQLQVAWILAWARPDLAFFPHWNIPILSWTPFVCFIHDLILFHHPESAKISTRNLFYTKIKQWVQRIVVRLVVWRARWLFVPTQAVANDVAHFFPKVSSRLKAVGEGVSDLPKNCLSRACQGSYFLTVGSAYPHKRLDLVLRAWKTLSARYPNHSLVLVGEQDAFRARLQALASKLALPRVIFPGQATDEELASWYSYADLLLFPSEDEGFGLPPLEALALGCPVLSSDIPVLQEVLPKQGVRFFRNGDLDDMMRVWNECCVRAPQIRAEVSNGAAMVRARHSWDEAAQHIRSFLLS